MDEHHVIIRTSGISCGILELSRLSSDAAKVAYALASHLYHPSRRNDPAAIALWSDIAGRNTNGATLSALLASVTKQVAFESIEVENPVTSNMIQVYMWYIPHEQFKKWYQEQRVERAKKV